MRNSRFLVLPSFMDHWPLVVSEASLSGCGLILSNKVGNAPEFVTAKNGFSFNPKSDTELYDCLVKASLLSNKKLDEVYKESLRLGSIYTPKKSGEKFSQIINDIISLNY